MKIRDSKDILNDIKELVNSNGYIYALCLIIIEDFHFEVEQIHEINYRNRLNKNEIALLLGVLIKSEISIKRPNSPKDLINFKKKTNILMEELHLSTNKIFHKRFNNLNYDALPSMQDFFKGEDSFTEAIFYSGDGIYDFQYLEYLEKKYKYDEEWLYKNKNFRFKETINIALKIKKIHNEKIKKINFIGLKEDKDKIAQKIKKKEKSYNNSQKSNFEDYLLIIEFYQFNKLYDNEKHLKEIILNSENFKEEWNSFYNELLNLFCIAKDDFKEESYINCFLNNFSIPLNSYDLNNQFETIGDFNLFAAKPIIQIDNNRSFIPVIFSLFEAIYESPYYWMLEDKTYKNSLAYNRGKVGEEITYKLLEKGFGSKRIFKSIRIESKKGLDSTDIDVLCILGSKALCVQVKSKKLTQISRKGNFEQLQIDFKGAVQDAYKQGLISREKILDKSATFYDSNGKKINLLEDINEVYILGVTTENYPALTHQTSILLEKDNNSPFPLFLTIFDLEIILFYLNNPYDFLYYVRQRINLMEYYNADEEINYLGYHLSHKLWKDSKIDFVYIDTKFGQLIDQNFYPIKLGIETSSEGDVIKNLWKNIDFENLCKQIENLNSLYVTDVIFHLLDLTVESRDELIYFIKKTKTLTSIDNNIHNFTLMIGPNKSRFGLTYVSFESNNLVDLTNRLLAHSICRKYKCKADYWIGLGSLKNSSNFVDCLVFNNSKWSYDKTLELETKNMFEEKKNVYNLKKSKKIKRNQFCPCGSDLKYKFCCGK